MPKEFSQRPSLVQKTLVCFSYTSVYRGPHYSHRSLPTEHSPRPTLRHLGRSNTADGPASLRCNALLGGDLPSLALLRCTLKFYITLVSHTVTLAGWAVIPWRKNAKSLRVGSRPKLDWKNPVLYTDFFFDAKQVLAYVHGVAWDWLQSKYQNVKPHTNKITQVTSHKCFGSAI